MNADVRLVSDAICGHCGKRLGTNHARCWWCLQELGDYGRRRAADVFCEGENAPYFAPKALQRLLGTTGVFYVLR